MVADNSFFHQDYSNKKILVLVPHEDDEINVAGNLIYSLANMNAKVYVVFSTNGDYQTEAKVRVKEAFRALDILGVPHDHAIFMGYGDSYNDYPETHISESGSIGVVSNAGHNETYCDGGAEDFAYKHSKKHSLYTRKSFCSDLKEIILFTKADLIVCVDYDQHPDHRWLSLAFDEVMGEILRSEDNCYKPYILRKLAYALAFSAVPDLTSVNLLETQRPEKYKTNNYLKDVIDTGNWYWKERIRLLVSVDNRINCGIMRNRLVKAMLAHKSQLMILHAEGIINSDDVFWGRRTDSIAYFAHIDVSSGDANKLIDGLYINTRHIKDKYPIFEDYLWLPTIQDKEKRALFTWEQPQKVSWIKLYSGYDEVSVIRKVEISLDDGFKRAYDCQLTNGQSILLDLGLHEEVGKCVIRLIDVIGDAAGIAECEIFSTSENNLPLEPFIKICIEDNFVYHYLVKKAASYPLSVYKFRVTTEPIMEVIQGSSYIEDGNLIISKEDKQVAIKAYIPDTHIYDTIVIERNPAKILVRKIIQKMDHAWIMLFNIPLYLTRWRGYIKEDGIKETALKALEKVKRS